MSGEEVVRRRAAEAATAVERLARSLTGGTEDRVVVAYVVRLLEAAARVEDYTEADRSRVEPDPNYLRGFWKGMGTTAERNP